MATVRATCWSLTINNPTQHDEEQIAQARQRGWKVDGQKEIGKEGTPHYQLIVRTPQVRFSAVKKAFTRAHIEIARNAAALEAYVHKEETKVGEIAISQERYPSQGKVFAMFADWIDDDYTRPEGRKGGYHSWTQDRWVEKFETFVGDKIREGYFIEQIAVNPQTISIVKKYGLDIYIRSKALKCSQTDRQTDSQETNVAEEYNNDGLGEAGIEEDGTS